MDGPFAPGLEHLEPTLAASTSRRTTSSTWAVLLFFWDCC